MLRDRCFHIPSPRPATLANCVCVYASIFMGTEVTTCDCVRKQKFMTRAIGPCQHQIPNVFCFFIVIKCMRGFAVLEGMSRQQWLLILQLSTADRQQTEISPVSFCNFGDFALQTCEQDTIHAEAAVWGVWGLPHCNKESNCVGKLISVLSAGKWSCTADKLLFVLKIDI